MRRLRLNVKAREDIEIGIHDEEKISRRRIAIVNQSNNNDQREREREKVRERERERERQREIPYLSLLLHLRGFVVVEPVLERSM